MGFELVLAAILLWFATTGAYVLVMSAKAAMRSPEQLSTFWLVNLIPWAVVGFGLDISFNLTFGTAMFLERPREWLFTSRCKRHKSEAEIDEIMSGRATWRGRLARWWCAQLNVFDAGHC